MKKVIIIQHGEKDGDALTQNGMIDKQKTNSLGIVGAIWENDSLVNDARIAERQLLDLVIETLQLLADNERALIVSHDCTMLGLEKVIRTESFETDSHTFGELEGLLIDEDLLASDFGP